MPSLNSLTHFNVEADRKVNTIALRGKVSPALPPVLVLASYMYVRQNVKKEKGAKKKKNVN